MTAALVLAAGQAQAQPAPTQRQSGGLVLQYGLVPAEMVIAVPRPKEEREMHGGAAGRSGSHLVLTIFDEAGGQRISQAEVMTHITLVGGPSTTKRLELMKGDQPSFGAFVPIGAPGIYKIRFEVKRPGVEGTVSAEFEHRVAERRR